MTKREVRKYDKAFKLSAIQLYLKSGRSVQEIGQELGIPPATLATWAQNYKKEGDQAFPGKGHLKATDQEAALLRKELAIVREERDILKKALGIFSSRHK